MMNSRLLCFILGLVCTTAATALTYDEVHRSLVTLSEINEDTFSLLEETSLYKTALHYSSEQEDALKNAESLLQNNALPSFERKALFDLYRKVYQLIPLIATYKYIGSVEINLHDAYKYSRELLKQRERSIASNTLNDIKTKATLSTPPPTIDTNHPRLKEVQTLADLYTKISTSLQEALQLQQAVDRVLPLLSPETETSYNTLISQKSAQLLVIINKLKPLIENLAVISELRAQPFKSYNEIIEKKHAFYTNVVTAQTEWRSLKEKEYNSFEEELVTKAPAPVSLEEEYVMVNTTLSSLQEEAFESFQAFLDSKKPVPPVRAKLYVPTLPSSSLSEDRILRGVSQEAEAHRYALKELLTQLNATLLSNKVSSANVENVILLVSPLINTLAASSILYFFLEEQYNLSFYAHQLSASERETYKKEAQKNWHQLKSMLSAFATYPIFSKDKQAELLSLVSAIDTAITGQDYETALTATLTIYSIAHTTFTTMNLTILERLSSGTRGKTKATSNPYTNAIVQILADNHTPVIVEKTIFTVSPVRSMEEEIVYYFSGNETEKTHIKEVAVDLGDTVDKMTAQLRLLVDKNAVLGLGSAHLSTLVGKTVNVLGKEAAQIIGNGSATFKLNSDIIINSGSALLATKEFGNKNVDHLTFTADRPVTITLKSGVSLDLTSFNTIPSETNLQAHEPMPINSKQIIFDGKIRFIVEPGAHIRFPYIPAGKEEYAPIIQFTNGAELFFQPSDTVPVWTKGFDQTERTATQIRSTIKGVGQIWLNKGARMNIPQHAFVGVEADYKSPRTDLILSIQNEALCSIGSSTSGGGALQIGNIVKGGLPVKESPTAFPNNENNANPDFAPRPTSIAFTLQLKRANEMYPGTFQIGKKGFLGCGAGIVNKESIINATDTNTAWHINSLHDVAAINLLIEDGTFTHNCIAGGDNEEGSLLAFGPSEMYVLSISKTTSEDIMRNAHIAGGGNVLLLLPTAGSDMSAEEEEKRPYEALIKDTYVPYFSSNTTQKAAFSLLASTPLIMKRGRALHSDMSKRIFAGAHIEETEKSITVEGLPTAWFYALTLRDNAAFNETLLPAVVKGSFVQTAVISDDGIKRIKLPLSLFSFNLQRTIAAHHTVKARSFDSQGLPTAYEETL